jgi:hypothetical protein
LEHPASWWAQAGGFSLFKASKAQLNWLCDLLLMVSNQQEIPEVR